MRFALLVVNDSRGAGTMLAGLSAGWDDFGTTLDRFGGRLVDLYAAIGTYDALVIADFDDPSAVLAYSLAARAEGQNVVSFPLLKDAEIAAAAAVADAAASRFEDELAEAVKVCNGTEHDPIQ